MGEMRLDTSRGATCCGSKGDGGPGFAQGLPNALRERKRGVGGVQGIGQDEHVIHPDSQHQEGDDL